MARGPRMNHPGRGRLRLLVFVALVCASIFATTGAAQADNVVIDEFPQFAGAQNQADVLGPAGSVQNFDGPFSKVPLFNVSYAGLSHLQPGSQIKVSMNPGGPQNAIFEEQTFTLPSTWGPNSTFSFRPQMKWTMSTTLGRFDQFVSFTL